MFLKKYKRLSRRISAGAKSILKEIVLRFAERQILLCKIWSAFIEGETPVPIPNTAVKPLRADGSVVVRLCESRSVLL